MALRQVAILPMFTDGRDPCRPLGDREQLPSWTNWATAPWKRRWGAGSCDCRRPGPACRSAEAARKGPLTGRRPASPPADQRSLAAAAARPPPAAASRARRLPDPLQLGSDGRCSPVWIIDKLFIPERRKSRPTPRGRRRRAFRRRSTDVPLGLLPCTAARHTRSRSGP